MARNYAALPYDYLNEMEVLNDAEFGRLTRALLKYSMTGEPIALCGNERFFSKRVMNQEDRFKASYEEQASIRSARGKAGAEARWSNAKNAQACLSIPSNAKNGNTETKTETNTDTLPSNDGKSENKRAKRFSPPTVDDVRAYCQEIGYGVDPEKFVDYYTSNGWKVGENPMKDWKAAVRTWEKGNRTARKQNRESNASRELDSDELDAIRRMMEQDGD